MTTAITDATELSTLFRDAPGPVRLSGRGTSLAQLPAAAGARSVSLAGLDRLTRLDPGDLTCTVEPGLPRAALDVALEAHHLVLPVAEQHLPTDGSLGGLFARGDFQPLAPGAPAARHLLLGLEGVSSDGTLFKSGAQVVKSVAGFDLHKLFVGSRGRLFAATKLHLKLRPAPRSRRAFAWTELDADDALARYRQLRGLAAAPTAIALRRQPGCGFTVDATIEGAPEHVKSLAAHLQLAAADDAEMALPTWRDDGAETVDGTVQPSALPRLLDLLPPAAPVWVSGTGQFRAELTESEADQLLAALEGLPGGAGEIRTGAEARRGRSTPLDPTASSLQRALKQALDPNDLLR